MADDVRRSGRANKGHHTKNADALDEPVAAAPKSKGKSKPEKKAASTGAAEPARSQSEDQDKEEDDAVIRCVCGDQRDIRGREMICCDNCQVWQHNRCLNLPEGDYWDGKEYFCEQCKPEQHVELLAAMERGEKPWNRKKGQKPPKTRPSDVKTDAKQDKSKASTPAPVPTPPPTQTQTQTGASPAPAPSTAPKDSTTKSEAKASKKETPKSQPQSPIGEKRRHESAAEKDQANKKRRKSSAPQADNTPTQTADATEIDTLPAKQKVLAERLRDTLVPLIEAAVADSRGYQIPDGETSKSLATQFALQIDHAALLRHGEPVNAESPFSHQIRSIIFNIKKNTILIDRLLTGGLSPEELASMAPELMASEEKQREYAAMREANEKQMVLTEEPGPRLRKTHKGEEIVGEDYMPEDNDFRAPPPRDREPDATEQQPQSPPRDGQMTVELPEDVGRTQPLTVDTSSTPVDEARRPSAAFDINSVFDKVRSPQHDQQSFIQRRQNSIRSQDRPQQGPGIDPDVDRLLKDEDHDVEMSDYRSDPSIVWQGAISMQNRDRFEAVARLVAGGDFGQVVPWDRLLASTLSIQGRIESSKGDEYIRSFGSTSSHDICVLALSPVLPEGKVVIDNLYNYFAPRNRWGVVPMQGHDIVRDLYVIPIPPGGSNLPPFLDMLEHCIIETPRKEHMMLLALIGKIPDVKPTLPSTQTPQPFPQQPVVPQPAQAPHLGQVPHPGQPPHPSQAPNGPTNGTGPSPSPITNPHAPQYSPVGPSFPPGHNFAANSHAPYPPTNLPHHNGQYAAATAAAAAAATAPSQSPAPHTRLPAARIAEIMGKYMNSPTVQTIVNSNVEITEPQMLNLRVIMDNHPEAVNDINVLTNHLAEQGKVQNAQS